jgi:hypothetical protein
MRIKFEGRSTPAELVSEISDLLIDLAKVGVDELDGINLYLNLRAQGEPAEIRKRGGGGRINILSIRGRAVRSYAENDADAPYSSGRVTRRSTPQ